MARAGRDLSEPQRPQLTAHGRLIERDVKLIIYPKRQVLATPAHDTVDRRDRPALDDPGKRLALSIIKLWRLARRFSVNQTIRPVGIETQHPVSDYLQPDIADPRRIRTLGVVVNLGQRKRSRRLCPASFDALANRRKSGPS